MNQIEIGKYISTKRRALNLTQEQLADLLGVSNKTISKWENGKCMPDYSIIEKLCSALHVTLEELLAGEDASRNSTTSADDRILELLRRTQELERIKYMLVGAILIVLGIASNAMSATIGGSHVKEFISGLLLSLSICEMITGTVLIVKKSIEKNM